MQVVPAGASIRDASLDTTRPWLNVSNGLLGDLGAGAAGPVEPGNRPAAFEAALQVWQNLLVYGLGKTPRNSSSNSSQAGADQGAADDPGSHSSGVGAIVGACRQKLCRVPTPSAWGVEYSTLPAKPNSQCAATCGA